MSSVRTAARFLAVQTLYQLDLVDGDPQEAFDAVAEMHEAGPEVRRFGFSLVEGTLGSLEDLDRLVAEHLSESWNLSRLGKIEKAVMRMASHELVRDDEVPTPVILNEAIELTRDFLDEDAVRFVNGVLDRVAKAARPPAGAAG